MKSHQIDTRKVWADTQLAENRLPEIWLIYPPYFMYGLVSHPPGVREVVVLTLGPNRDIAKDVKSLPTAAISDARH